ncbi:MAG: hypothetical protein ABS43_29980 [Bordetella sp. SCN 67-23]|uniref:DMT family protein n=1 Tax=Pigmentiphaga kullae TaxID=151784 RepID=A0A4Q7NF52_9BURK|nr:DMT family protein [Pigmentiphaga kullae]MBN9475327.1 DMT family protein [Burkholderiales bacterium]ODS67667.1 MAG: hypothetical protein ABS43_29980 [Bordetella sp. SCN 67-23]OJW90031.1 MAG: hypothetical protein BGO71_27330 [Burkholderiales bacterium 67-32]RZS81781.1 hypothetical protein EV675_4409 [Pigmentiphaga kullae]
MAAQILGFVGLLALSNMFMTFAWYGHLRYAHGSPWYLALLASWGLAFFEYAIMVPANRYGFDFLSVTQMKILQEVVTLTVFVPFALLFMDERLRLNHLWAACCLVGAVYFAFKK